MREEMVVLLGGLSVIAFAIFLMVVSLRMQKRGLIKQHEAVGHIDESLVLSRRSVELQEKVIALCEQSLKHQEEMIRLLRELTFPKKLG